VVSCSSKREELVARFYGLSIAPHTVLGLWLFEGTRFEDEFRRFTIDVADTPENRQYFLDFKTTLLQRFAQVEIYR